MAEHPTMRTMNGMPAAPAPLSESTLVMIDLQNTYTRGAMELEGVQAAIDEAAALLSNARDAGIPVVHVMHDDGPGSLYDVQDDIGRIVDRVAPRDGESVVVKNYPNAFVGTDLHDRLQAGPTRNLVIAGFMTHMCVESTARGAFSLGYSPSVVAGATATRELPGADGGPAVSASTLQVASLAAIADLFGVVVAGASNIPA